MAGTVPGGTSIVSQLACSLAGQSIKLQVTAGTRLAELHAEEDPIIENTTCNYGLDPAVQEIANQHGMVVSAIDDTGEVRAIERSDQAYFLGTLYQPQLRSEPGAPHPVFAGLIAAAIS